MEEKKEEKFLSKMNKKINDFLYEEEGNISRGKMLTVGSLLIIAGFIFADEVFGAHSSHSSHSSHRSHSSHSSHKSHYSHSSSTHGSHASHSNTHSSHASHSNTHSSHSNLPNFQKPQVPPVTPEIK
ncbi:MAG: His-Xaa-Ser repeat protein HxsA3 [Clostridia bacterium]|nr:His-Xaa-Ser repeat protein HxsA3 [Clostridia bacterium]